MTFPLAPSNDPLLARALAAAEGAWRRGQLARARELLQFAVRRATLRADAAGALSAHQLLGHIAFQYGDLGGAESHHRMVLELSERHALPLGVASALHNLGLVAAARGEGASARDLVADALARYEALGHEGGAAAARTNLAHLVAHWARRLEAVMHFRP